jgi:hypothetical protein
MIAYHALTKNKLLDIYYKQVQMLVYANVWMDIMIMEET